MNTYKMYIDGQFTDAISGKTYLSENPANGEIVGEIPLGGAEDVEKAVKAATKKPTTGNNQYPVKEA